MTNKIPFGLSVKRFAINFITTPFLALGFLWQFIGGGFMAGRLLAQAYVARTAVEYLRARGDDIKSGSKQDKSRLH